MKNKTLIILVLVFVIVIAGAYVLYGRLSESVETEQLAVQQTPEVTPAPTDTTEETSNEETEPEKVFAPDFTVYDAEGNPLTLSSLRGKPVVVNFWASWCSPCKGEMPDFEEAYKKYGADIQFLIVNMTDGDRETVESAQDYIESVGYTFPVFYDTQLEAAYAYAVYSIPATYFINAEGYCIAYANSMLDLETLERGIGMITE
ncbi:MAG: TlpA family protein disulfide reductase [Oscillospiraceae bacterium]|nr:TlpA family protein disulfide reductase [Oscillospiraceae bacterium]